MGTENNSQCANPQTNTVLSGLCEKFHRSFKYDENIVTSLSSPVKVSRVKKIDPAVLNKNTQRSSSVDDPFFFH
jgi:hypothetical protein